MLRRVQITFEIVIDDRRTIEILDHAIWSLLILNKEKKKVILDTELKMRGEKTYQPSVSILDDDGEP